MGYYRLSDLLPVAVLMMGGMFLLPLFAGSQSPIVMDRESWNFTQMNATIGKLSEQLTECDNQRTKINDEISACNKRTGLNYWQMVLWMLIGGFMFWLINGVAKAWQERNERKKREEQASKEAEIKKRVDEALAAKGKRGI